MRPFIPLLLTLFWTAAALAAEPFRDCQDCPAMVEIPAGRYLIGSPAQERQRENVPPHQGDLETPQVEVTIGRRLAIGLTEVTVAQYAAFVAATGHPSRECEVFFPDHGWLTVPGSSWDRPPFPQSDDHPVICVGWADATAYAAWLADKTGAPYRLPSETEWEYAARAGTQTARYWGDSPAEACRYANVADAASHRKKFACDDGYSHTAPAGFGIANGFGLHGMLGNVGEWTADCSGADYATTLPRDGSPFVDGDCESHVGRGGSWWNARHYIRAARRYFPPGAYNIMGFRVARDLD